MDDNTAFIWFAGIVAVVLIIFIIAAAYVSAQNADIKINRIVKEETKNGNENGSENRGEIRSGEHPGDPDGSGGRGGGNNRGLGE